MTVPASVTGKVQYEGDGETTAFSIDFPIFLNTQGKYGIRASVAAANGDNATVLTEGTDFTITASGTLYHTLTLSTALAVNKVLTVIYDNEFSQLYAPTDFTSLPAATLIKAFDKLTGICIQIKEELERCVKETAESTTDPNIVIQKVNVLYEKIQMLTSVCDRLTEISTVSANILNVNSLADITVQINTLAEQITALLIVSTNISNVNTCSANITAILDAPNQASAAAGSAATAQDWAAKMDGKINGVDYSSKYYADLAKKWSTSSTIIEDGKYGASYYALQAYNANVSAQNAKTRAQEWASKTDGPVEEAEYSAKWYALNSDASGKADKDLSNLSATGEAHFANPDMSNLSTTGKSAVVDLSALDYTAGVDYTSNWGSVITVQKNGWLWVRGNTDAKHTPIYLIIGSVSFNVMENGNLSSGAGSGGFFRIPPTQFQVTGGNGYARQMIFFPCKGA